MNRNNNSPRRSFGPLSTARRAAQSVAQTVSANHATITRAANTVAAFVSNHRANTPTERERLRGLIRFLARSAHVSGILMATQLVHIFIRTRPALAAGIVAAMWGHDYIANRTGSVIRRTGRRASHYVRSLPGRAARAVGSRVGRALSPLQRRLRNASQGARTARMY